MRNYTYIFSVFKALLEQSDVFEGRFYVGHRYGLQDINYDELGEVITSVPTGAKYPLVMSSPPRSFLYLHGSKENKERFRFDLFFCAKSKVKEMNDRRYTSDYDIPQDWQDMKRSALSFMKMLELFSRSEYPRPFSLIDDQTFVAPFSEIGADKISGVKLDFSLVLGLDCDFDTDEYPVDIDYFSIGRRLDKEYDAIPANILGSNEFVIGQSNVLLTDFIGNHIRIMRNNVLQSFNSDYSWDRKTALLIFTKPIEDTEKFTIQPY